MDPVHYKILIENEAKQIEEVKRKIEDIENLIQRSDELRNKRKE